MLALEKQHILLLLASACAFRRITLLCFCLEAFRAEADTDAAWASLSPLPCRRMQDAVRSLQRGPYYPAAHVLLCLLLWCQNNVGPLRARKRGSWWLRILTGRFCLGETYQKQVATDVTQSSMPTQSFPLISCLSSGGFCGNLAGDGHCQCLKALRARKRNVLLG